jgi:hypothetical protein
MKFIFSTLVLFLMGLNLKAHEVRQAHFLLKKTNDRWMIEGDFPWTLRNALIQFDPKVEQATDQKSIDEVLFSYVQSHLILKTRAGNLIPLTEITRKGNPEHSHQILYEFHFEKGDLAEITNKLMFNLNDDHLNFLVFRDGEEEKMYKFSKNSPIIRLENENHLAISSIWMWTFLISILGILVFGIGKKKGQF